LLNSHIGRINVRSKTGNLHTLFILEIVGNILANLPLDVVLMPDKKRDKAMLLPCLKFARQFADAT